MEKLYKVTFIEYTNYSRDTVCCYNDDESSTLYADAEDLIIKESDLKYWTKFGKGLEKLDFVGNLRIINERTSDKEKLYRIDFIEDSPYPSVSEFYEEDKDMVVQESDLDEWKQYRGGIKTLEFIGFLGVTNERPEEDR
jgi:hypothetical protein